MGFIDDKIRMAAEVMRQNQRASHLEVNLNETMTQDPLAYIKFLLEEKAEKDLREKAMIQVLHDQADNINSLVAELGDVKNLLADIREQLRKSDAYGKAEHRKNEKLKAENDRLKRELYGDKQDSSKNKNRKNKDHNHPGSPADDICDEFDNIDRQQGKSEFDGSDLANRVEESRTPKGDIEINVSERAMRHVACARNN